MNREAQDIINQVEKTFKNLETLKDNLFEKREELIEPILHWFAYTYLKYVKADNLKFSAQASNNYLGIIIKFKNELESDFGSSTIDKKSWFFGTQSLYVSDHITGANITLDKEVITPIKKILEDYNTMSRVIQMITIPI